MCVCVCVYWVGGCSEWRTCLWSCFQPPAYSLTSSPAFLTLSVPKPCLSPSRQSPSYMAPLFCHTSLPLPTRGGYQILKWSLQFLLAISIKEDRLHPPHTHTPCFLLSDHSPVYVSPLTACIGARTPSFCARRSHSCHTGCLFFGAFVIGIAVY